MSNIAISAKWLHGLIFPNGLSNSLYRTFVSDYSPELRALGRQNPLLVRHPSSSAAAPCSCSRHCTTMGPEGRETGNVTWSPKGQPAKAFYCKNGCYCIYCYVHWFHSTGLWINFLMCLTTPCTRARCSVISVNLCLPVGLTQPDIGWTSLEHICRILQNLWLEWGSLNGWVLCRCFASVLVVSI